MNYKVQKVNGAPSKKMQPGLNEKKQDLSLVLTTVYHANKENAFSSFFSFFFFLLVCVIYYILITRSLSHIIYRTILSWRL